MKVRAEQFAADLSKVDWSKVPASMKQDGEKLKAVAPFYAEGGDFKAGIDNYVAALNAELSKAKPKAAKKAKAEMKYDDWEEKVIHRLMQNKTNGDRGDAVGILQANEFRLSQAWGKNLSPTVTAKYITDAEPAAKPKAAKKAKAAPDKFVETRTMDELKTELMRAKDLNPHKVEYWKERIALKERADAKKATGTKAKRSDSEKAAAKAEVAKLSEMGSAGQFAKLSMSQILEVAQSFEANRSMYSQFVDEGADNKKRLTPTPENLVRWMKEPGKYDLIGIDTFEKNNPTADLKIKKEIFWARLLKK